MYPRVVTLRPTTGFQPQSFQILSTAAEKAIVKVESDNGVTGRIGFSYSQNEEPIWFDNGTIMTFDGPRHPFWRPFYLRAEGGSDIRLQLWLSGTQDGPIR
jgi:hypothetical protein